MGKKYVLPALFAGVAVFLVNFLSEYMFEDLRLLTNVILNALAALVGAFLGVIISEKK